VTSLLKGIRNQNARKSNGKIIQAKSHALTHSEISSIVPRHQHYQKPQQDDNRPNFINKFIHRIFDLSDILGA
jgi:hypothetical protein